MISLNLTNQEMPKTDLEILANSLEESVPDKNQTKIFPSLWKPSETGLCHRYSKICGINNDDQLVEVHYYKELNVDIYDRKESANRQYGRRKTRQFSELFQEAITKDQPSQEESEAIKQVFEHVYEEGIILRKSHVYKTHDIKGVLSSTNRFVLDTVKISNKGGIWYSITGLKNDPSNLNFQNNENPEAKTEYFGFQPSSFLKNGYFKVYMPLLAKGPIRINKDSIEEKIRTSLQSSVNQNQEEIRAGVINSLELYFFNQGNPQDLFFYFNKWLRKKV